MKKLFYLLLLLPLGFCLSCKDDNDLKSPVDMTLTLSGVTQVDNNFYTVAGENITIEALNVKSVGGQNAAVTNLTFFVDGYPLIPSFSEESTFSFSTENLAPGTHTIGINGNLLQVDSSIQVFAVTYNFNVVDSQENLPAGAPDFGSYSQTIRLSN